MKTIIDLVTLINQTFARKTTIKTATLATGATTVTFTQMPTSGDKLIDFYASNGANYKAIDTSTPGTVVLTYDAPESEVTVYCEIKGV